MQGYLREESLKFTIQTECAHCGEEIHISMDDDLNYSLLEADAQPLVFLPTVDFSTLEEPSIIDAF